MKLQHCFIPLKGFLKNMMENTPNSLIAQRPCPEVSSSTAKLPEIGFSFRPHLKPSEGAIKCAYCRRQSYVGAEPMSFVWNSTTEDGTFIVRALKNAAYFVTNGHLRDYAACPNRGCDEKLATKLTTLQSKDERAFRIEQFNNKRKVAIALKLGMTPQRGKRRRDVELADELAPNVEPITSPRAVLQDITNTPSGKRPKLVVLPLDETEEEGSQEQDAQEEPVKKLESPHSPFMVRAMSF